MVYFCLQVLVGKLRWHYLLIYFSWTFQVHYFEDCFPLGRLHLGALETHAGGKAFWDSIKCRLFSVQPPKTARSGGWRLEASCSRSHQIVCLVSSLKQLSACFMMCHHQTWKNTIILHQHNLCKINFTQQTRVKGHMIFFFM